MFLNMKIGDRFGRFLVVGDPLQHGKQRMVMCKCEVPGCTTVKLVRVGRLNANSRGCDKHRALLATKHGKSQTKAYRRWQQMISRCHSQTHAAYDDYGGRGIKVCDRWLNSFEDYLADVGDPPPGLETLDRRDNDGGYEPGNVRWASRTTQAWNRRSTKLEPHEPAQIRWLVSEGYSKTMIGRFFGIRDTTVHDIATGRSHRKEPIL